MRTSIAEPLIIAFALIIFGCSSGGSSSSSAPSSPVATTAKIRFINAAARIGTVNFSAGGIQAVVPTGSASAVFDIPAGTTNIAVTSGSISGTRSIAIPASSNTDVVAFEAPTGALSLDSFIGQIAGADPNKGLFTYYNYGDAVSAPNDVYFVSPGTDINATAATFQAGSGFHGGGTIAIAPGTYNLILTPMNGKTPLFQSASLLLSPGEQLVVVSAPSVPSAPAPQPIVVTFNEASTALNNNAPATVKLLRRLEPLAPYDLLPAPAMIKVDGNTLATLPAADVIPSTTYTLVAGTHSFSDNFSSITYSAQFQAGAVYVQRFGFYSLFGSAVSSRDIWVPPDLASDYPAPSDKARIRLIIDNWSYPQCNAAVVRIDGVATSYGSSDWGVSGPTFDHAPGNVQLELIATSGFSAGPQLVPVKAGHYYVLRSLGPSDAVGPHPNCTDSRAFQEISGDE